MQLDDTWWGVVVPLPPDVDNTTAELLALALGRWIAGCLRDLRAWAGEVVYDAEAAESLVAGCRYRQWDPLRKAISGVRLRPKRFTGAYGATWRPRTAMKTMNVSGKGMPRPMSMRT